MSTKSRKSFDENCKDVERLLAIHKDIAGHAPGRKYGVEVLNKSAIVLICAFWEAYIEDLADEALDAMVNGVADFNKLPLDLRKRLAKAVKTNPNDLSPWDLAGNGWQTALRNNLAALKHEEELGIQLATDADISRELGALDERITAMETIVTCNLNLVSRVVHTLFKRKERRNLARSNVFNV